MYINLTRALSLLHVSSKLSDTVETQAFYNCICIMIFNIDGERKKTK